MSKDDIKILNNHVLSLFRLYDTTGLPVDMAIHQLQKIGLGVSIPHFIADARKAGWKNEKIGSLLRQACLDTGLDVKILDQFLTLDPDKLIAIIKEWEEGHADK